MEGGSDGGHAFFDIDGTLIAGNMHDAVYMFVKHLPNRAQVRTLSFKLTICQRWWKTFLFFLTLPLVGIVSLFSEANAISLLCYFSLRQVSCADAQLAVRKGVTRDMCRRVFPDVLRELQSHQEQGRTVVLLTGNLLPLVRPFARSLGAKCAATLVESRGEVYTGYTMGQPMVCDEKASFVRATCDNLPEAHAYGNSKHDLPFMIVCGNAVAVKPCSTLRRESERRGWPRRLLDPKPPQATYWFPSSFDDDQGDFVV